MSYYLTRRLIVILIFLSFLSSVSYFIYDKYIAEKPSCFDHKKNGDESGVDCGGKCQRICDFRAEQLNINWARAFEVTDGVFNVVASIDNPNFNYRITADCLIKYLNNEGVIIGEKQKTLKLSPLEKKIVFIPNLRFKGDNISRVYFVVKKVYDLKKEKKEDNKLVINSKDLKRDGYLTKLNISVENIDFEPKHNIQVNAILFNSKGNAIDANRTYIDYIDKNSRVSVDMTWPREIRDKVAKISIILKVMPDEFISI